MHIVKTVRNIIDKGYNAQQYQQKKIIHSMLFVVSKIVFTHTQTAVQNLVFPLATL